MVPDPEVLPGFAEKLGVKGSIAELCKNQVCRYILASKLCTSKT